MPHCIVDVGHEFRGNFLWCQASSQTVFDNKSFEMFKIGLGVASPFHLRYQRVGVRREHRARLNQHMERVP